MSRVLAISGSIRAESFNTRLLESLQTIAPAEMSIEVWKGIGELPHFSQDLEAEPPTAVVRFREAVAEADGLIISTPEYNRMIPGVLKNALDWVSRPYAQGVIRGTAVAAVAASPSGTGALPALIQLRSLLGLMDAYVVGGPLVAVPEAHQRLTVAEEVGAALNCDMTRGLLVQQLTGLQRAIEDNAGAKLVA